MPINSSSAARPSSQVRHIRAEALPEDDSADARESGKSGDETPGEPVVGQHGPRRRQRAQTGQLPGAGDRLDRRGLDRGEGQRRGHFRAVAGGERGPRAGGQAKAAAAEGAEQEDVQVQEDEKRGS